MPGEIRIDADSLSGLEGRITGLCDNVYRSVDADLSCSPTVAHEYNDFVNRWDDTRNKLFDGLTKIAEMLKTVRESFAENDQKMADKLDESRSRGGGGSSW